MRTVPVGIVGASGYTGLELSKLVAAHPHLELAFATSDRFVGEKVGQRVPLDGPVAALPYVSQDKALSLAENCPVVFLATPAEASMALAPLLLEKGVRVVDLSGAFRLKSPDAYPKHYGFAHQAPGWLEEAVYGLPEFFAEKVKTARLVANPGCYATAVTLSLLPLLKAGLLEPDSLVVNAASGVTGAGRKASEDYSFCEIDGDFRAYRVFNHQHTPEISQTLSHASGQKVPLTFTPHLLPTRRGILSTAFALLKKDVTATQVASAFQDAYAHAPYVTLAASAEAVALKRVLGTNRCEVGFAVDKDNPRRLLVLAAIDNLLKGASGQAMQNLNLMLGFGETLGVSTLRGSFP